MFRDFWREKFPDLRIDVFISVGVNSSFLHTGLSLPQAEAIVRRVIAVHNETVGPPYLVYAGATDQDRGDNNSLGPRSPGIVIDSFSCAQPLPYPCADDVHACATISGQFAPDLVSKARVTLQPLSEGCPPFGSHTWDLDPDLGPDIVGILLHEIGHTLGLDHTDISARDCGGPTDGAGGFGVMAVPPSFFFPSARDWRRDDLEALRAIYGEEIDHAVYSWLDAVFPEKPGESTRAAICAAMRTPPTLTSTVGEGGPSTTQFVVFTDGTDRVMHLEWDGVSFVSPGAGAVIDPGELGISFAPAAIAISDDGGGPARVLAIWSAAESKASDQIQLRWALRDVSGGPWSYGFVDTPDGPTQRSNDVAVGFDAGTSSFLVASITDQTHPYFVTLDLQGDQGAPLVLGDGFFSPPFVFDVGRPNCYSDGGLSRCVIPYIRSDFDQFDPEFEALRTGWFDLELDDQGSISLMDDTVVSDVQSWGMVDLASGPEGFRGITGERRYTLERLSGTGATNTPVMDMEVFPAGDWPLRIGSQRLSSEATSYRLAARRRGRLCGNGFMDCDEWCDDGNSVDGDGCSATCSVESAPTTGDATEGSVTEGTSPDVTATGTMTTAGPASATDTGPVADEGGCGCRAADGRASLGFLALAICAVRCRRRSTAARLQTRSGGVRGRARKRAGDARARVC